MARSNHELGFRRTHPLGAITDHILEIFHGIFRCTVTAKHPANPATVHNLNRNIILVFQHGVIVLHTAGIVVDEMLVFLKRIFPFPSGKKHIRTGALRQRSLFTIRPTAHQIEHPPIRFFQTTLILRFMSIFPLLRRSRHPFIKSCTPGRATALLNRIDLVLAAAHRSNQNNSSHQ